MWIPLLLIGATHANEIQVVSPGECIVPSSLSYLLPEPMYDNCLAKASALGTAQDRIAELEEQLGLSLGVTDEALTACTGELDTLTETLSQVRHENSGLTAQNAVLRRQRTTAWAITGGLLTGAAVAIAVLR